MLVGAHNGGIDYHVFVVGIARQQLKNTLENPALGPPAEALVDDFPIPKRAGRSARGRPPDTEKNGLDEQTIIRRGTPDMTFTAGKSLIRSHWSSRYA
jgi:hypothetical protein